MMSLIKMVLGVTTVITLVVGLPVRGHAQSCASDADCSKGTTCQRAESSPPARGTVEPACGDAGCKTVLASEEQSSCQAGPCENDADCGTGMVCYASTVGVCSGGAAPCPANTDCGTVVSTPESCTTTTTKICAYSWQLPCSADSDCGADFTCAPTIVGTCSGSSGSGGTATTGGTTAAGAPDGGEKPAATPVGPDEGATVTSVDGGTTCTSTATFPGTCQAKARTCTTDADCPAAWTCAEVSVQPADGSGTATRTDSGAVSPEETSVSTTKVCQSPAAFPARGPSGEIASDVGKGADGGGQATGAPRTDAGTGTAHESASSGSGGCSIGSAASLGDGAGAGVVLVALSLWSIRMRRRQSSKRQ